MFLLTRWHGILEFAISSDSIPLIRLLRHHSPNLRVEGVKVLGNERLTGYYIPLEQLDLTHEMVIKLNRKSE